MISSDDFALHELSALCVAKTPSGYEITLRTRTRRVTDVGDTLEAAYARAVWRLGDGADDDNDHWTGRAS
jgi:hypothetical protein